MEESDSPAKLVQTTGSSRSSARCRCADVVSKSECSSAMRNPSAPERNLIKLVGRAHRHPHRFRKHLDAEMGQLRRPARFGQIRLILPVSLPSVCKHAPLTHGNGDAIPRLREMRFQTETVWWARRDSNPQPSGYEPPALTIELQAPPGAGLVVYATRHKSLDMKMHIDARLGLFAAISPQSRNTSHTDIAFQGGIP